MTTSLYAVVFVQLSVVVMRRSAAGFRACRGHAMAVVRDGVRFDQIAAKWHALAQRRLAHVPELEPSARWRRFYSEERFGLSLGETERVAGLWAKLAATRFTAPPGENSVLPAT
jgi:hypothetical protein